MSHQEPRPRDTRLTADARRWTPCDTPASEVPHEGEEVRIFWRGAGASRIIQVSQRPIRSGL